jgi:hypothetical protein
MSPEARNWLMHWRVRGQPQVVDLTDFYTRIPQEVYDYVDSFLLQIGKGTVEIFRNEVGLLKVRVRFEKHKKDYICVSLEQAKTRVRAVVRAHRKGWI